MRNFLIFLSVLAFQFSVAQEETVKDSTKTTEFAFTSPNFLERSK